MKIRVAVCQFEALPAYATQRADYLSEPAPPSADSEPYLDGLDVIADFASLSRECRLAHAQDLGHKLDAIALYASRHQVDLLVLPEYSVPCALLPRLYEAGLKGGFAVVAGSHTVTTGEEVAGVYREIGLARVAGGIQDHVRMAMAPVLALGDRTSDAWFKHYPSKAELDMVPFAGENADVTVRTKEGGTVRIAGRICIDALRESRPIEAQLLVVVAASWTVEPFEQLCGLLARCEVPSVFANMAAKGQSGIVAAEQRHSAAFASLLRASANEEVVIIADVELGLQFEKRGSVITAEPARLVARGPILYEIVPEHARVIDLVRKRRSGMPAVDELGAALQAARRSPAISTTVSE